MKNYTKTLIAFALIAITTHTAWGAVTVETLWETTSVRSSSTAKQAAGWDGVIYVQDYSAKKIYQYQQNGSSATASEYLTNNVGTMAFNIDENGNKVILNAAFSVTSFSSCIVYKKGTTTPITINFPTAISGGNCRYIKATGKFDTSSGGYVWIIPAGQKKLHYVKICNLGKSTQTVTTGTAEGEYTNGSNTFNNLSYVCNATPTSWVAQPRSDNFYVYDKSSGTKTLEPNLSKRYFPSITVGTLGACKFTFRGDTYFAYQTSDNYTSKFIIRNFTQNTNMPTKFIGDGTAGGVDVNSAYANWLNAQKIDDYQTYLYQYCPGVGAKVWIIREYTNYGLGTPTTSNVQALSATVKCTATGTYNPKTYTIKYGTTSGSLTSSKTGTVSGKTMTFNLTGLTPSTTYYYKITSTSDNPIKSESKTTAEYSFTTPAPTPPSLAIPTHTYSGGTYTFSGSYTKGTYDIGEHGFGWGPEQGNLFSSGGKLIVDGTSTSFSATLALSLLEPSTTYYYCSYVYTVSPSALYSTPTASRPSFVTPACPTVTTQDHTFSNLKDIVTIGGTYATTDYQVVNRGFYWSTSASNLSTTGTTITLSGAGKNFKQQLTGLEPNTTYYYQAFVTTSHKSGTIQRTTLGAVKSFTTPAVITIGANESKEIPYGFHGNVVMNHGGQITNNGTVLIYGRVFYKRIFEHPTEWSTLCFPFYIYNISVEDEGEEYEIEPVHSTYPYSGHFWLKTMTRDSANYEIHERWNTPPTQNEVIWGKQPHIIAFPDAGGYYTGKTITFATQSHLSDFISWDNSANSIKNKPEGAYFVPNYTLKNQLLTDPNNVSAFYRLDLSGSDYTGSFEERKNTIVKPTECFIRFIFDTPMAASMAPARVSMSNVYPETNGSTTAAPPVMTYQPLIINQMGEKTLLISDLEQKITIFATNGTEIATFCMQQGSTQTIELPRGVYVIKSNKWTQTIKFVR